MGPPRLWVRVALLLFGVAFAAVPANAQKASKEASAVSVHVRTTGTFAATTLPSDVGQWGPVLNWPLVSVHSVLQPSGQVLVWDGFGNGPNSQRLWNPSTGSFIPVPNANNLFCAGQLALADGRTIVVGGHVSPNNGLTQTNIFDPATNTWTRAADMSRARWYPTGTTLGDGRVLVVSGDNIQQDNTPPITPLSIHSNTTPEIYNPRVNSWTSLPTAARAMPLYPFMFQLPDGRVLDAGPELQSRTLNLSSGTWTNLAVSPIDGHSAVMYRPGKILKTGKWTDPDYKDLIVHGRAAVLDTTVANPAWREVASMAFPRSYHTLVALPDGNVLSVGGDRTSEGTILANGVLTPEIWNATTETWTSLAPMQTSREYHSTALLLPDARILVSGGGALPGSATDQTSAEVYSPPYLFKGPRPTITSAPSTVQYATNFSITTPDAARIASAALLRTPAVTHAFDQNQRYVPLTFTATANGLDLSAPANGNVAPPGYYMLFIVDTNGVPSVASFVRLPAPWEDSVAPSAPTGLTATGGLGSIGLMWTPSVDNTAVTGYDIHRSTTPSFTPSAANRVGQTTVNNFTDTGLAAGTYYYVVVARDAAGNASPASNVAFATATADTVAPTVSITAPAANATVSGVVAVTANASDNVALAGVQFLADGSAIGAEDTAAPYSADWNSRAVANGTHTLTAVARDAAGNTTTSAAVSVKVSNSGSAGLVAAYSFDSVGATVPDNSGNGNAGTPAGTVWTAQGRYGGALSFGGVNEWVTVPDSPSLDLADAMTLEAWVRPVRLNGVWRTVLVKEQPANLVYGLYAGTNTNVPDGVAYTNGASNEVLGTTQLPVNTWSHLAATYDGSTMRLYVNGTLAASTPVTGTIPSSDGALRIGGNSIWGEYFEGLIDEVRIYGRALTQSEIQTDLNTPVTPPPPPPPPADTTPPTAPGALSATGTYGSVALSWTASTDNVGVVSYNVYRSTTAGFTPSAANLIAQPTGTSYTDGALAPGIYYYRVTAVDAAGNTSPASSEAIGNATDRTAPSAPPTISATGSLGRVSLSWGASTDNVGVVRYNVHRSTTSGFAPSAANRVAQVTTTSYVDSALTPATYYYVVTAEDAAGNVSAPSAQATGFATDTSPPTVPTGLTATGSPGTVTLTWTASTDDAGVAGYDVYRSTVQGFSPSAATRVAQPTGTSYTDTGLSPGIYYYRVTAVDGSGNTSSPSAEVSANAADVTAPTAPAALTATGAPGSIALTWAASSDNVAVVGYDVYRSTTTGFTPSAANRVTRASGTSYTDSALTPGVYYYRVAAVDAAGNASPFSLEASATATDGSPPTAPAGVTATGSPGSILLSWTASTDNVGVAGYDVYRSTVQGFTPSAANRIAQPTGTSYTDTGLSPGIYYYRVTAVDGSGNTSSPSAEVSANAADVTAPTAPAALTATGSPGSIALTWAASSDNVGVVGYDVYRSTTTGFTPSAANRVTRASGTSYTDSALTPGVYYYRVAAVDAAGNASPFSLEASATATDGSPPTAPAGVTATGSPGSILLSWTASTDNVGVAGYDVYRSTVQGFAPSAANRIARPTGTSYTDAGLAPGIYYYRVTAVDGAGNISALSVEVSASAADATPPSVPSGLTATGSPGSVGLSWNASTDDVGVAHYDLYRSTSAGFTPSAANRIAQPTGTSYSDTGLAPATYYYRVAAVDAAGNTSTASAEASALVVDVSPPSAPAAVTATGAGASISLSWTASSDDVAVTGYNVYRSTTAGFTPGVANRVAQPSGTSYTDAALAPGTYYYRIVAVDAAGNASAPSAEASAAAADVTPPTAPSVLTAASSTGSVSLSWTAATDDVGVAHYELHRSTSAGFTPSAANRIAQPTGTSYSDTGLAPATYYYRVLAVDAAGNAGAASLQASATVADTTPPSAPAGVTATGSLHTVALAWSPSSDDIGVVHYNVHRSAVPGFVPDASNLVAQPTGTAYKDSALAPGVYYYLVTATDAAGNVSAPSAPATGIAARDTTAPSTPAGLSATSVYGRVDLAWTASSDDVGVVRYNVHRSQTPGFVPDASNRIAQPTGTSYTDAGLAPGLYYYAVTAEDAAGNVSAPSAKATGDAATDTAAPTQPAAVSATGSLGSVELSWTASSDDVAVVRYNVHRSQTPGFVPDAGNRVAQPTGVTFTDSGLAPGVYYYRVTAEDGRGNVSAPSTEVTGDASDRVAPAAPSGLAVTVSPRTIGLSWSAPADNVGVVAYSVHRSTTSGFAPTAANRIGEPSETSYSDTGLAPGTYYYVVTARDAAGNVSAASAVASGTVLDTTAPSAPANVTATGSMFTVALSWSRSSDDVAVTRYNVYRSQTAGFTPNLSNRVAQPTGTSYTDTGLVPGTYYYVVTAEDAAGNVSTASVQASGDAAADSVAPSAPEGLSAKGTLGSVELTWSAASDNVAVTRYDVHRSKTPGFVPDVSNRVAQPTGTTFTDSGLAPGVYYYRVTAEDAAGNLSAPSTEVTGDASDRVAPLAPGGLAVTVSPKTISLSWSAPADNVGVVAYSVHRSSTPGFAPTAANRIGEPSDASYIDTGLAPGAYYYVVTARDAAGNVSAASAEASGTVLDTTAPSAPANVTTTGSMFTVALSWSPSSDDVAVTRYNVYRSQTPGFTPDLSNRVAQPTGTSYTDAGLAPGTYYYVVTAEDAAGNVGRPSLQASGDAAPDSVAPSAPTGLSATGSLGTVELTWSAASDNVAVVRYNLHRSQTPGFVPDASNRVAQPAGTTFTDGRLAPGVYYYRVTAEDAAGNVSAASAEVRGDASDRVAPAAPGGLAVTVSPRTISLSWSAPADNVGVVAYSVHRSSTPGFAPTAANRIGEPSNTSYSDTGLAPGAYYYVVTARDAAGNVSAASAEASGTVLDTTAPSAPANVTTTGSMFTVALSWSPSSDDVAVTRYNVYRSQTPGFAPGASNLIGHATGTSYTDSALAPGTYYYVVTAEDAAGNVGAGSAETAGTAAGDTSAPSAPEGLSATGSLGTVALTWSAATDNVKVARYNVYRSATPGFVPDASNRVAQPTTTSYTDSALRPGIYYYRVTAEDAAGNVSAASAEARGDASDTVAPAAPGGLSAAVSPRTVTLNWTAPVDNVGVVAYSVHRSTTPGFAPTAANRIGAPTATTYTDTGLAPGTYYYVVTAKDAAGNVSAASAEATGTVLDTTPPSAPAGVAATGSMFTVSLSWSASSDDVGVARYNVHRSQTPGFVPSASNLVGHAAGTSYTDSALAPGTYYYVVTAEDAAGNVGAGSTETAGTAARDTAAPSAPAALSANATPGTVSLSWNAATDNVGVVHYNVHRSNTAGFVPDASNRIAQPTTTSYTDSGLAPGTYYYRVTAEDAAGNVSAPSAEATGVAGDVSAPVVTMLAPAVGSTVSGSITVSASASDNVGVSGVQFKLDGVNLGAEDVDAPYSVTWDTRLAAEGSHVLTAVARDAAGNSSTSASVGVTVQNQTGLVAAYSFDAGSGTTVADVSGNGNKGTISNTTWLTTGRFGGAMFFDNLDMVSVPNSPSLNLTSGMTIEAWVRASQTTSFRTVAVKEGPSSVVYGLYAATRTSPSAGDVGPTGVVMVGGTEQAARSVDKLLPDVWTHVASTYDGTTLRVYVDGNLVVSRVLGGPIATAAGALRIGGNTVRGEFFRGLIDELRIYKRALSQAEIRADMNVPVGP